MSEQRVTRPTPISGFPEWLPEIRSVEQRWLDHIRAGFERYGFASVETPSVEALDVLMAKGETSQEVYTLHRLQADADDDSDARLGLHFDLTVPFARYVAQHFNELVFPFKRYQIQRVWRGERPQEGRFREFTQCDIDVINVDQVPLHFDAELPRVVHEVLSGLDIPAWTLNINNRKVLQGCYEGLGIGDPVAVIRAVDKLHKIGDDGVRAILLDQVGLSEEQAKVCLDLAHIRGTDTSVVDEIARLGVHSELLTEGLDELGFVLDSLADLPSGSVVADLSVARGLDYYTGTVYEAAFRDDPGYGSICAGGRYENLAGQFIRRSLPGVGISIGLTRIFAKLVAEGRIATGRQCPTDVLVVVPSGERRGEALRTAARLREAGHNTEVYHQADKVGKQIRYASRKGIPFVWFPPFEDGRPHEVKDLASGEQTAADPATWSAR
ncbi:histidine--tRNA ligase [Marinitenerispora sediminis]|uniref:Histidine--tRNA ligase n=1 Tax=Marinitenerispora sediminis TaxID=1931232 RepID=A0A368T3Y8_9ACTN|nr:histidine--tRNA ligase [Marinitenerispora sediminis]RCV52160.1 histidine--tRNA ligase [Marinitenerispora sediminis]RCV52825.1 histidine--tRNA ligase [Marinitenerispora sediminis]RCV57075.1 histidine--tRNA ligase [Marinitenerispora sediminis]